jgi:glycosyltransferase involved in cell wall biosynthesis
MTLHAGFPLIGGGAWTGGLGYLKNTLNLIRTRLDGRMTASVFLSPDENQRFCIELSPLVDGRVYVDPAFGRIGRPANLAKVMLMGRDNGFERAIQDHKLDVFFEAGQFYGPRTRVPVISWIPDLQHRFMPEMFGRVNWWRRDIGFRMQAWLRPAVMVSSLTAQSDLETFYPSVRGRSHVVRFSANANIAECLARGAEMRSTYDLPAEFFFLPNQFWTHKNHEIVIHALGVLKSRGRLSRLPPIALSGLGKDPRNPGHFERLFDLARRSGVENHFRYLGLIPYDHVLSLIATCRAMINPSRFEGWSTPIEEAKAFATPLVLSDIAIHREQAPAAMFFDPGSAEAAADALELAAQGAEPSRPTAEELIQPQDARIDAHARSLLSAFTAAAQGSRHGNV